MEVHLDIVEFHSQFMLCYWYNIWYYYLHFESAQFCNSVNNDCNKCCLLSPTLNVSVTLLKLLEEILYRQSESIVNYCTSDNFKYTCPFDGKH